MTDAADPAASPGIDPAAADPTTAPPAEPHAPRRRTATAAGAESQAAAEPSAGPSTPVAYLEFGEEAYCEAHPDIHAAIRNGLLESAALHYRRHGRREQRLATPIYQLALRGGDLRVRSHGIPFSVDAVVMSQSGHVLVVGWMDDRARPLRSISIICGEEGTNTRAIGRCRRPDVDALLKTTAGFGFGFWLLLKLEHLEPPGATVIIRARLADGSQEQREMPADQISDPDLRETALGHFANLGYYGNRDIEAFNNLETGLGQAITSFNRSISAAVTAIAHAEHYGPRRTRYKASVIVCLFGKLEYFFLQNALFATTVGIEDYEFIYVSNSPELAEALQKEARVAAHIYGLSVTLVTLPGNAGFSAANNAAVRFARSERLIFMNPDVFPRDAGWAKTHEGLIASLPREHTALFGAPLYYDDGSLMHGGMYFEIDQGLSVKASGITQHGMVRVEHYGKGAPVWSDKYTLSRPVPAVTGAFISADREWFQHLGGFTEDYVFGHYEDADLCLKSLSQRVPVWMHDIRFWHLEGKGSVRRAPHEGGSLVNRWLFTRRWGRLIADSLCGRVPSHPLLNPADGEAGPSPADPKHPAPRALEPEPAALVRRPSPKPARDPSPQPGLPDGDQGASPARPKRAAALAASRHG